MKKRLLLLLLLPFLLLLPALAEETGTQDLYDEQLEASGAEQLFDNLPDETKAFLDRLGITGLQPDRFTSLSPRGLLESLFDLLSEQADSPLRTCGMVLGIVLLCALMDGVKQTVKEPAVSEVFGVVCALAACAAVLLPVSATIQRVCAAAQSTSIFMTSFVPVYAGVLLTNGQAVAAASYNTIVLFVAELISLLATQVIVPLMTISLALGLTGSVSGGLKLDAAAGFINKAAVWLLGLTTSLFVGLLTLQGVVGAAADTLAGRAVKFSLASFVPVVGGALSEAFSSVQGCLALLKSTLGGFGILATALIVLPPLLECAVWSLTLSVCGMAAEMFSLTPITAILKAAHAVVKTLIGVLAACALFMIVATTIVTVAGGAAAA